MAEKDRTYREQLDANRILQIREIARELPQACGDFLNGISLTTGTFTRLAYAIDLKTFFQYLHEERVMFSQKPLRLMNDDDLALLSRADLDAYIEYLTYYFKDADRQDGDPSRALVNHEKSIKRKLCAIRSMYEYLFKAGRIATNVPQLV